ncbi:MAG: hypothetical protein IKL60_00715 [Alistipes sp.]|nr:hypothetical protein [Alistipes sp.]
MKRVILFIAVVLVGTGVASAWSRVYDKAVLEVAYQSMDEKTQQLVVKYVGEDYTKPAGHLAWHRKNGRMLETAGWHTLHLDANLQPAAKDENDALVQTEKALQIIRNRKSYDNEEVAMAIRIVMNLVIDMHNLSNVKIEGIELSGTDFKVGTSKGTSGGRTAKITPYSWKSLWTSRYNTYHGAYSPQMYAEDIKIMFGNKREEFSRGSLNDWVHDIGLYTKQAYDVLEQNNRQFLHKTIQEHEEFHMSCLARASYRLAALLNETLK